VIETDVYVKFETNLKEKFGRVNTPLHIYQGKCTVHILCITYI
jgi:hypothetical protein